MGGGRSQEEWQVIESPYKRFVHNVEADREYHEQRPDIEESPRPERRDE
jgi:hypothetical protein